MQTIKVRVTCQGSRAIPLAAFKEMQGELKSLSEQGYRKLRKEILLRGISFPVAVWSNAGVEHVIDGHQRVRTLRRMAEEGIAVPLVPVADVDAANEREAKEKVLAGASQYGAVERDGLYEFMHGAGIDFSTVNESFQFPEIDLPLFHAEYFAQPKGAENDSAPGVTRVPPAPDPETPPPRAPSQGPIDVDHTERVTYKLLPEDKEELMAAMDDLMRAWKLLSHAEVLMVLAREARRELES